MTFNSDNNNNNNNKMHGFRYFYNWVLHYFITKSEITAFPMKNINSWISKWLLMAFRVSYSHLAIRRLVKLQFLEKKNSKKGPRINSFHFTMLPFNRLAPGLWEIRTTNQASRRQKCVGRKFMFYKSTLSDRGKISHYVRAWSLRTSAAFERKHLRPSLTFLLDSIYLPNL